VDIVLQDEGGSDEEGRRIATLAVITLPDGAGARPVVHRIGPDPALGPTVSIVIPHHGRLDVLRTCLRGVRETTLDLPGLEVLVVDDASPDLALRDLEACVGELPQARLLVNDTNMGFLATANRGVAATSGDIIVLLNNDTLPLPGWLPPLLRTFHDHPDAGVVGGRLVYPDGRLQEAGGLVFRDGTAAKFGYGDPDPDGPMYTFLRVADYVSGALLATPRALFEMLGGLDTAFGFGFYEDTDYCFRARRAGRLVLYQPESTVIHVEGATAGLDLSTGPKRSQAANEALFRERWVDVLRARPRRPGTARPEDWYAAALTAGGWEVAVA
jgi:GT2 family glycosyltransferase